MKRLILPLLGLALFSLTSCSGHGELYSITDEFVESLYTEYDSYGMLGGTEFLTLTEDSKYQVMPTGRLINVKIMEAVDDEAYEDLRDDLERHYRSDDRVKDVYISRGGTIMIDCRK